MPPVIADGGRVERIQLDRASGLRQRFRLASHAAQEVRIPCVRGRVAGVELDRAVKLTLRTTPVPLPPERNRERRVRVGRAVIECQRTLGCLSVLERRFSFRQEVVLEGSEVHICHCRVGIRVARVALDCTAEVLDRSLVSFSRPRAPEKSTAAIEQVRLWVAHPLSHQQRARALPELDLQRFRDFLRNLLLPIALAEASRGSTSRRGGRARRAIVVAEVAMACVLCAGAGLLIRSLGRVLDVQPGFETENLIAVGVDPSRVQSTFAQRTLYFEEAVRAVRSVPGVQALGLTDALPLGDNFGWRRWNTSAGGSEPNADQSIQPLVRMIDEGYLAAMKIPVRAGRTFTTADDSASEPVIIINETLARTLWPGKDPIGRVVSTSRRNRRVVGVVGDVRYLGLDRGVDAEMYMPVRQTGDYQSVDLVVRGAIPATALAAGVRASLRRVDASLPVVEFRTMEALVDHSVFARRFTVLLVAGFAAFGLLLSCLGLYAVISYSVSQRTQEIGIRMALGATPASLRVRIFSETGVLVLLGIAMGLPASWLATRAIRGLLFGVGSSDPVTYTGVLAVLGAVAVLAGYVPARRATRIDPAIALRPR